MQWCHHGVLFVGTPRSDFALKLGSNREGDTLLFCLNYLLTSHKVQEPDSEVSILNVLCLSARARGRERETPCFLMEAVQRHKKVPFLCLTWNIWIAASHAHHLLREEPFKACMCQPCHSGMFPWWACSNRPLSYVNPSPGIAHAKWFKAVNIKVNAMPVILTIFKARRQTHTHAQQCALQKKQCCGVIAQSRKLHHSCKMIKKKKSHLREWQQSDTCLFPSLIALHVLCC